MCETSARTQRCCLTWHPQSRPHSRTRAAQPRPMLRGSTNGRPALPLKQLRWRQRRQLLSFFMSTAARATNPDWRVLVLTDPGTNLSFLAPDCTVIRLPVDASRMMHARMRAYRALLRGATISAPVAFLDTDVCVNRSLSPLFDGSFDVALTFRINQFHMPFNEGVILGANGTSAALAAFFDRCLAYYDFLPDQPSVKARYPFDVRMWRGGQLSLAAFTQWRFPPLIGRDAVLHGVRCRFLPCEEFNYPAGGGEDPRMLTTKYMVHFKGAAAKQSMRSFCANLIAGTALGTS